ncbi:MAG: Bug family tripartite tricarboxylate transporter substrate binding protein [Beijerinckiaceae bacterium]
MKHGFTGGAMLFCASLIPAPASADPVEDFYRGKVATILIGVSAGGEYDLHARLIARHLGKQIPGSPTFIAQNMTGAGGIIMANYLFNVAPQDGTHFGVIQNGFPGMQAVGKRKVQFQSDRFHWIGAIAPTVETMALWKTAGAANVKEAQRVEIPIGSVGNANITYGFPMMMNAFAGTKFRMVIGYRGGNDINLAMERGEVGGRNNTWSSWKSTRADWLKNKDIHIIAYGGPKPADIGDVPSIESLATSDEDRLVMRLVLAGAHLGRPLVAPPGVPGERVAAVRRAFLDMTRDPEFLKEAQSMRIEVNPVRGEDMEKLVREVLGFPEKVKQRAGEFVE